MGTVGEDYYARLTGWITPKLMLRFELDRALIGNTTNFRSSPESVPDPAFMRLAKTGAAQPWPFGL
jgi:hypothetical protein